MRTAAAPHLLALLILALILPAVRTEATIEDETERIKAAARDYMDGVLAGDVERVSRSVHPELNKVGLMTLPKTERVVLRRTGLTRLLEIVRVRGELLPEMQRCVEVEVFHIEDDLAAARVSSARYYDLIHLVRIEGEWKVLSALWIPFRPKRPTASMDLDDAMDAQAADHARESEGIRKAALDYIEGAFSADAERLERVVHPELSKVSLGVLGDSGRRLIDHMGSGLLIEITRADMIKAPKSDHEIEVIVHEISGEAEIAAASVMSGAYYDLLQLAKIGDQWKIINVLWKVDPEELEDKRDKDMAS